MSKSIEKLIEQIINEVLDEVAAISAGGASLAPSGQVSGTGGTPLGRDMSDQHDTMWSGDEPENESKKEEKTKKESKNKNEEYLDEDDLDEFSAVGGGAVAGYSLPVGMKPDHSKMGTKKKKKKRKKRWYDVGK